jgi:hypothetical protein
MFIAASFAQVQRKSSKIAADTSNAVAERKTAKIGSRKEQMKELDLTREQKVKLKEIRQTGKAKKAAIEADDKLSNDEKKTKLKELQKEQLTNTMSIMSEEQKEKMKTMRKQNKGNSIMAPEQ